MDSMNVWDIKQYLVTKIEDKGKSMSLIIVPNYVIL